MNTILHLLSPSYLFAPALGAFTSPLAWVYLSFNVLLILIAIVFEKLAKNKDKFVQKTAQKYSALAWVMGLIGIILYIFRQLGAFYLSAPIGILLWLAVLLVWAGFIAHYWFIYVPKRKKALKGENLKKKYLP